MKTGVESGHSPCFVYGTDQKNSRRGQHHRLRHHWLSSGLLSFLILQYVSEKLW